MGAMTEEQRTLMLRGIVYDADRMDAILRLLVDAARVGGGDARDVPRAGRPRRSSRSAIAERCGAIPIIPRSAGRARPTSSFVDPARAEERDPRRSSSRRSGGAARGRSRSRARRDRRSAAPRPSGATGPSSRPEEAERLFAPRRPGTGAGSKIGLFVARGVAEAQGGRRWAEVDDGRLSFHLEIAAWSAAG